MFGIEYYSFICAEGYNKFKMCICRVCLKQDRTVVSLDRNDVKDSQIFRMLDDLVHPAWVCISNKRFFLRDKKLSVSFLLFFPKTQYSTRAKLPDEICKVCIESLKKAFELKQRYKESIYDFAQEQNGNETDPVSTSDKNIPNASVQNEIVYVADSDNEGDS